jgi:hypothetical protein
MDYRAACHIVANHQSQQRFWPLRRLVPTRCRRCGQPWPCVERRQARQVIIGALNVARHP